MKHDFGDVIPMKLSSEQRCTSGPEAADEVTGQEHNLRWRAPRPTDRAAGAKGCCERPAPAFPPLRPRRRGLGSVLLACCLALLFSRARAGEVAAPSPLFTLDTVLRPAHLGGMAYAHSPLFTLDTRSPEWCGIQVQPPATVRLELKGLPGRQYDLETSSNLLDWVYLDTLTATSSILTYVEAKMDGPISRFYRAVLR